LAVTGLGSALLPPFGEDRDADARSWLRNPKLFKFMGRQDRLAVIACGRALAAAGLGPRDLGPRAGVFLVAGYLPFDRPDIEALLAASMSNGRLSMQAFSTTGIASLNPLLTFRCLPNMPAYHVSATFDIQGPYVTSYPGPGQLYGVVEAAAGELETGTVDVAVVCGVAHQRNFLVQHHLGRLEPPVHAARLADAAGSLVLETHAHASRRGAEVAALLVDLDMTYRPFDPAVSPPSAGERCSGGHLPPDRELGPASLPLALMDAAGHGHARFRHDLASRDGLVCSSVWDVQ